MGILTTDEALGILRMDSSGSSSALSVTLAAVDEYLKAATGHDWATDEPVDPEAKAAAQMLLVQWYENPAMIGEGNALDFGLSNLITHLQLKGGTP